MIFMGPSSHNPPYNMEMYHYLIINHHHYYYYYYVAS